MNCLSVYMLEKIYKDALFIVKICYDNGWNISNLFSLGDLDTLKFWENVVEEARD